MDPGYGGAWHNITGCLIASGRYGQALEPAKRAHRLQPEDAGSAYNLAVVKLALGHRREGIALLEEALHLRPDHGHAKALLDAVRREP